MPVVPYSYPTKRHYHEVLSYTWGKGVSKVEMTDSRSWNWCVRTEIQNVDPMIDCMGMPSLPYSAKTWLTGQGQPIMCFADDIFFFFFTFLRQGFSAQPWLSWNSLPRPGWPRTQMSASASWVLGSKACITTTLARTSQPHQHRDLETGHSLSEGLSNKWMGVHQDSWLNRMDATGNKTQCQLDPSLVNPEVSTAVTVPQDSPINI